MLMFIAGILAIVLPMPIRLYAAVRLMNTYPVDDYLRDPAARRLWLTNFGLAILIPIGIMLMALSSGIWWVVMWAAILAVLVTARLAWKVRLRLTGAYREVYRAAQWSGPPARR